MLLRPSYLEQVGLFEESFFLYYEDVDLSWRGRARGWRYAYVPAAVARHVHAASGGVASALAMRYAERNRLVTLVRNAPARLAAVAVAQFVTATASYALRGPGPGDGPAPGPDRPAPRGGLRAVRAGPPRSTGPAPAAPGPPTGARRRPHGLAGARSILLTAGTLGWPCPLPVPTQVLVLTPDTVGPEMAGPGIRSYELARVLAAESAVTLASPYPVGRELPGGVTTTFADRGELRRLVGEAEVVVAMASLLHEHRWIGQATGAGGRRPAVVADAYDPVLFEVLAMSTGAGFDTAVEGPEALARMTTPLELADLVLSASTRQRHLLLGMMAGLGRVNPLTYAADPTFERFVAVVPFGLPTQPPDAYGRRPLRGPDAPFDEDDFVALWGGGLYEWLDPVTLIDAIARIDDPRSRPTCWPVRTRRRRWPAARWRSGPVAGPTSWASPAARRRGSCSATTGCPTTSAPRGCSTPMSPCRCTGRASRPPSPSAPACSTPSGPASR